VRSGDCPNCHGEVLNILSKLLKRGVPMKDKVGCHVCRRLWERGFKPFSPEESITIPAE